MVKTIAREELSVIDAGDLTVVEARKTERFEFQPTYFEDWLRWTGVTEITPIRCHPTLNGSAEQARQRAHAAARERGERF